MLETIHFALHKLNIYKIKFKYIVLRLYLFKNYKDIDGCCKKILKDPKADLWLQLIK